MTTQKPGPLNRTRNSKAQFVSHLQLLSQHMDKITGEIKSVAHAIEPLIAHHSQTRHPPGHVMRVSMSATKAHVLPSSS